MFRLLSTEDLPKGLNTLSRLYGVVISEGGLVLKARVTTLTGSGSGLADASLHT